MASNVKTYHGFSHFWGLAPTEDVGPKALRVELDFSTQLEVSVNLFNENAQKILPFVSGMWVENQLNPNPLIAQFQDGIQQAIYIPSFSQSTRPVFAGDQTMIVFTTRAVIATPIKVLLLNVPMGFSDCVIV